MLFSGSLWPPHCAGRVTNVLMSVLFRFQPAAKNADGKKIKSDKTKNVMRDLHIRKLCLNICVGESGDRLTRAAKVNALARTP